jgi:pimeloyl-ACP methyl ester carboxylesterase
VVLLHGLLMDSSLWEGLVADLAVDHRCVAPTLPLVAHRRRMGAGGELSVRIVARLVAELIERLGLEDVTVVGNDTGGALAQLLVHEHAAGIGRIVLVSCDAFDNYPRAAGRRGGQLHTDPARSAGQARWLDSRVHARTAKLALTD